MRRVEIIGGGIAGLALGTGLQRAGAPATVIESGDYPRHRPCGEFIHGLDPGAVARLGLTPVIADAPLREHVAWHAPHTPARRWQLPHPAVVVSRGELDARLADAFVAAGGELVVGTAAPRREIHPGRVFATGRRPDATSPWIGLKLHVEHLPLSADLEFHIGRRGYVGLCALDGDRVNVCGLFRRDPRVPSRSMPGLLAHLRAAELSDLAERLQRTHVLPESFCAVAGLRFGRQPAPPGVPLIGDAYAVVPPYTGHGMAMAFASAAAALDPLLGWARGQRSWTETIATIRHVHARSFSRRLRHAAALHPFLLTPCASRLAGWLQHGGLLPLPKLGTLFG